MGNCSSDETIIERNEKEAQEKKNLVISQSYIQ
jgi:hypothetical protein